MSMINVLKQLKHLKIFHYPIKYTIVYTVVTYLSLRKSTIDKEAVHIAIDITVDGSEEIL